MSSAPLPVLLHPPSRRRSLCSLCCVLNFVLFQLLVLPFPQSLSLLPLSPLSSLLLPRSGIPIPIPIAALFSSPKFKKMTSPAAFQKVRFFSSSLCGNRGALRTRPAPRRGVGSRARSRRWMRDATAHRSHRMAPLFGGLNHAVRWGRGAGGGDRRLARELGAEFSVISKRKWSWKWSWKWRSERRSKRSWKRGVAGAGPRAARTVPGDSVGKRQRQRRGRATAMYEP